jgi:SulP family sulfate permease
MGRLPETNTFRNLQRHPEALTHSDVVVYRMDASLYFANAAFLKDELNEIMVEDAALTRLVFDAYPVNDIDATGAETLKEIIEDFQEKGYEFYFAGVKGPVMDVLKKAGVVDLVGEDHFFMEIHNAVEAVAETKPEFANGAEVDAQSRVPSLENE